MPQHNGLMIRHIFPPFRIPADTVNELFKRFEDKLRDVGDGNVAGYERLLEEFEAVLKPTNYFVLTVKKYLADLYGFAPGFTYPELPPEKLDRKIEYAYAFLNTIAKVDPGFPKARI